MQKHQKIAHGGPKVSPKSSICQSIIACATPAIRKKNKHEKKKKMDKGLSLSRILGLFFVWEGVVLGLLISLPNHGWKINSGRSPVKPSQVPNE